MRRKEKGLVNILHLKYAVEVEKAGSITQAADNLYMAQPNLSKAIKELEDTLDITIFERTPRGVIPTPRGVEFRAHAKNILAEVNLMKSLRQAEKADMQTFSLTMPRSSYIAGGVAQFVAGLDPDRDMDIRIQETNAIESISGVADGRFRVGVIRYQSVNETYFHDYMKEKGIRHELLWTFENLLLMARDNPLSQLSHIEPRDLLDQVEIVHGDNSVPYLPSKVHFATGGLKSKKIYIYDRSTQYDLITQLPTSYMWGSPVPESALKKHGLVQRQLTPLSHEMKDVLICLEHYKLTRLDRLFIDCLFAARNHVAFQEYT